MQWGIQASGIHESVECQSYSEPAELEQMVGDMAGKRGKYNYSFAMNFHQDVLQPDSVLNCTCALPMSCAQAASAVIFYCRKQEAAGEKKKYPPANIFVFFSFH